MTPSGLDQRLSTSLTRWPASARPPFRGGVGIHMLQALGRLPPNLSTIQRPGRYLQSEIKLCQQHVTSPSSVRTLVVVQLTLSEP